MELEPAAAVDASWLLLRAVRACDADARMTPVAWAPLRQAVVELAQLQAAWANEVALAGAGPPPAARRVRFHSVDGSHLLPPAWGRDTPVGSGELVNGVSLEQLHSIVSLQIGWLSSQAQLVAPRGSRASRAKAEPAAPAAAASPPPRAVQSVVAALRSALWRGLDEAIAAIEAAPPRDGGRAASRVRAETAFLDEELTALAERGVPLFGAKYSDLLSSAIRQTLRRLLDQPRSRSAALLRDMPRGRGLGWLAKPESAAKMLSNALYEAHQLAPLLADPALAALLGMPERDARDALEALPGSTLEELLSLSEAHAVLRHLLVGPGDPERPTPQPSEAGWAELSQLLGMARDAVGVCCGSEAHFLPLLELARCRDELARAPTESVLSLVKMLEWASPQAPVHQRTRGGQVPRDRRE